VVNATWAEFFDHVQRDLGPPHKSRLRMVRGDTGASWEIWPLAAQNESARFRQTQRDVVSLRTLAAMMDKGSTTAAALAQAAAEVVALGDHAWNGSSTGSKQLNLTIRRRRLAKTEAGLARFRRSVRRGLILQPGNSLAVVNTLGFKRTCLVCLPGGACGTQVHLLDPQTGEVFPVRGVDAASAGRAEVTDVPAFGARVLKLCGGEADAGDRQIAPGTCPIPPGQMTPRLGLNGRDTDVRGGWDDQFHGQWRAGPFRIRAELTPFDRGQAAELALDVEGTPPDRPYYLRWGFVLPWKRCRWRGESGGGFVTPGPTGKGGDSLLGIAGSVFAAGEGLSAAGGGGRRCIDFAFDESGLCGLGGPTARLATGWYGQKADSALLRQVIWSNCTTRGVLDWYLLGTGQNPREALLDQGGARRWRFRCGLRWRAGGFDDAALHRFAAGFNHPAELVHPRRTADLLIPWLELRGSDRILVLGALRERKKLAIDLFNTAAKAQSVTLGGRAVRGRKIAQADMLARIITRPRGRRLRLAAGAFGRVVIE
jgi:hypothetical protein